MINRHPLNTNLSLHHTGSWHGYEVQLQHGPLVHEYLYRFKETLDWSLSEHPRTLAVRLDLRLPERHPFQLEFVMGRFISSLREQIKADVNRRRSEGKRVHDTAVRYIWVREQDSSDQPHFHVCLFFNKDTYRQLGSLPSAKGEGAAMPDPDVPRDSLADRPAKNLAERIVKAWSRAVGLGPDEGSGLVHFPYSCVYRVNVGSAGGEAGVAGLFSRISYLAKAKTKQYGMGIRHFGTSRR